MAGETYPKVKPFGITNDNEIIAVCEGCGQVVEIWFPFKIINETIVRILRGGDDK